jgi:hypothetical protein
MQNKTMRDLHWKFFVGAYVSRIHLFQIAMLELNGLNCPTRELHHNWPDPQTPVLYGWVHFSREVPHASHKKFYTAPLPSSDLEKFVSSFFIFLPFYFLSSFILFPSFFVHCFLFLSFSHPCCPSLTFCSSYILQNLNPLPGSTFTDAEEFLFPQSF